MNDSKALYFILPLLPIWAFLFCSCSGQSGKSPIDTNTVLGRQEKTFYNTISPTSASVIITAGPGQPAVLQQINSNNITSSTNLPASSLQFSSDLKILTIANQKGIFEYSTTSVSDITKGTAVLPLPNVDSYCNGFNVNGYTELLIESINGVLSFVAISGNATANLGNGNLIGKVTKGTLTTYQESGFGSLAINTASVSPTDSSFFLGSFSLVSQSPWQSATPYCHLNNVPLAIAPSLVSGWTATSLTNSPASVSSPASVWTGSKMFVLGANNIAPGGLYDPIADSWTIASTLGEPVFPSFSVNYSVWTGTKILALFQNGTPLAGGLYDPASNTWTTMSNTGAVFGPPVWTGSKLIVWSGLTNTPGAIYDVSTNTWSTMTTAGAPLDTYNYTVVWTGSKMLLWGGCTSSACDAGVYSSGYQYDPTSKAWTSVNQTGAPSGRGMHTAVWTGSKMIVWGGQDQTGSTQNDGGIYDPQADSWSAIAGAPISGREYHSAVWTGTKMIVWGGFDGQVHNDGAIFDPNLKSWTKTTTVGAPSARENQSAIWTGFEMIIWGGDNGTSTYQTGGRFIP